MKRNRQTIQYWVADFCSVSMAWLVFNILRYDKQDFLSGADTLGNFLSFDRMIVGQFLIPIGWVLLSFFVGYYEIPVDKSRSKEFFSTLFTSLVASLVVFLGILLDDLPYESSVHYTLLGALFLLLFFFSYIPRFLLTLKGIRKIEKGEWARQVMMIGTGEKAKRITEILELKGFSVCGYIVESKEQPVCVEQSKVLGGNKDLPAILREREVDEIVLATESAGDALTVDLLYSLYPYGLPVKVLSDRLGMMTKMRIKTAVDVPLVDVSGNNFSPLERNIKFLVDKIVSLMALVLLSPLFLYIAWRVKRSSPGPVFFRQERRGYHGKPFTIYKFRTMYEETTKKAPLLTSKNDDRITPVGLLLRKYRLDELPQFWNVLKGDMSLVGPRPERKYFIDKIVEKAPYYYLIHNVRPGITSMGMVKYGYAGNVDEMIERLAFDVLYYENMSLSLDLTILIDTVKTVIRGEGV